MIPEKTWFEIQLEKAAKDPAFQLERATLDAFEKGYAKGCADQRQRDIQSICKHWCGKDGVEITREPNGLWWHYYSAGSMICECPASPIHEAAQEEGW